MINRYEGEIHVNPIRVLRNDDFNNDGQIEDINETLSRAIELSEEIQKRMRSLKTWLESNPGASMQFRFAEGGYISIKGLADEELKELESRGIIELYDNALSKEWVKKYGPQFGLVWENGMAVEI